MHNASATRQPCKGACRRQSWGGRVVAKGAKTRDHAERGAGTGGADKVGSESIVSCHGTRRCNLLQIRSLCNRIFS